MKTKFKTAFSLIELSVVILIIGILVFGIVKGSRIIKDARIKSARALTKSSPVSSITDLVFWVDSVSEDSFSNSKNIQDNDTVTTWQDLNPQTTEKNNLTGTATYVQSGINSLPAMQFNGSSQYFDSLQNVLAPLDITYFVVIKPGDLSSLQAILATDGAYVTGSVHFNINGAATLEAIANNEASVLTSGNVASNKPYIATLRFRGSLREFFLNGDDATRTFDNNSFSIANKILKLNIASWNSGPRYRFFNGQIGEIIIFKRALNNSERKGVESYLKSKWNI